MFVSVIVLNSLIVKINHTISNIIIFNVAIMWNKKRLYLISIWNIVPFYILSEEKGSIGLDIYYIFGMLQCFSVIDFILNLCRVLPYFTILFFKLFLKDYLYKLILKYYTYQLNNLCTYTMYKYKNNGNKHTFVSIIF